MSAPLLGEKVERFRWVAVLVGFVGVLIALRPSPQMFSWGAPIALFGAIAYALSQTITRDLRGIHWAPLVLWQFVGTGLVGAATIPWAWTTPALFDLGLMALVGVVAMICIICIVRALALARAAVLAPLQYTGFLWAAISGWLVWRDAPVAADHHRQRHHHRQRPLCGGEGQEGRGGGQLGAFAHAPSRVAGHAPENFLPAVSSASTRNIFAPLGLKVKRKFGSSEIEMPAAIENTRSGP